MIVLRYLTNAGHVLGLLEDTEPGTREQGPSPTLM